MFPAYARTDDGKGFRDGVSEMQLNKELQKNGFTRIRDRRICAHKRSEDPNGAGMYLFSHLQWKDPSQPEEREVLIQWHGKMVKEFPLVMLSCKLEKFLRVVGEFQQAWSLRTESMNIEKMETESDTDPNSTQRSASVSPAFQAFKRNPLIADIRSLAAGGVHTAPTNLPLPTPAGFLNPHPLLSLGCGVESAQHSLSALQSQLTSSLLAVSLAKQQLQQAEHLSFNSGMSIQSNLMTGPKVFSPQVLPMS
eukprot:CAMPEP_0196739164 /NCGR_PEP_ID=MMETSP1091-20130531/20683_1 /TAXON_ID=302021 /ORGANISM="Rhodomonas sp., Strain CCMP768" /LENGTH=250 /DNA_ID=CAMNT_0042083523 /DNA_START=188 /DNA_END=940 /DNA_ORIENTATION=+